MTSLIVGFCLGWLVTDSVCGFPRAIRNGDWFTAIKCGISIALAILASWMSATMQAQIRTLSDTVWMLSTMLGN
jgi:hypothetical protein